MWRLSRSVAFTALFVVALVPRGLRAQQDLLYVCVQDEAKIAVVDVSSRTLLRTIDLTALGFSSSAKPHHVVSEADGSFVYVSLIGDNRIIKLDTNDRIVGQVPMETPGMLAIDPELHVLLASRSMSAVNPPRRVGMVGLDGFDIDEVDVFVPRPHPMVVARNGHAYTGSLGQNQLATIDIESGIVELVDIEGPPHALVQFAVSPDGRTLVASTEVSGRLLVFDLSDAADRPRLVNSIEVGPTAFDPVYAPDGRSVWVPVKGANEIAIIDAGDWSVVRRIRNDALDKPHAIVFSRDGSTAFVSNNGGAGDHAGDHAGQPSPGTGSLTIIDVATRDVTGSIALGANVTGLGIRPGS